MKVFPIFLSLIFLYPLVPLAAQDQDQLSPLTLKEKETPTELVYKDVTEILDADSIEKALTPEEGQEIKHDGQIYIWQEDRLYRRGNTGKLILIESSLDDTSLYEEHDGQKWLTKDADGNVLIQVSLKVWASLNFDYNSAEITASSEDVLNAFGQALIRPALQKKQLLISGHTDNMGSQEFNLRLSRRRAQSVSKWLFEHYGIEPERLILAGYGPTRPIADNSTPAGQAKNRRVEFTLLP